MTNLMSDKMAGAYVTGAEQLLKDMKVRGYLRRSFDEQDPEWIARVTWADSQGLALEDSTLRPLAIIAQVSVAFQLLTLCESWQHGWNTIFDYLAERWPVLHQVINTEEFEVNNES